MKHLMKFMASITVLLWLSGCMDTATRLWNGGPYISEKERPIHNVWMKSVRKNPKWQKAMQLTPN